MQRGGSAPGTGSLACAECARDVGSGADAGVEVVTADPVVAGSGTAARQPALVAAMPAAAKDAETEATWSNEALREQGTPWLEWRRACRWCGRGRSNYGDWAYPPTQAARCGPGQTPQTRRWVTGDRCQTDRPPVTWVATGLTTQGVPQRPSQSAAEWLTRPTPRAGHAPRTPTQCRRP